MIDRIESSGPGPGACGTAARHPASAPVVHETTSPGLCLIDQELRFASINWRMAEMTGRPAGDDIGRALAEVLPGIAAQLEPHLRRVLQGETLPNLELQGTRMGDACRDRIFQAALEPACGVSGEVVGALCSILDITERRQAEEALRESQDNYRQAVELSPHIPWIAEPSGRVVEISQRGFAVLGVSLDVMEGEAWLDIVHPEDRVMALRSWSGALRSGTPLDMKFRFRHADGGYRWLRSRAAPRRNAQGEILRWYGTLEDVHDRMLAEAALAEREAAFRSLFQSNPAPMWVYDLETLRFLEVNEAALQTYGWSRENFLGMTILDIRPAEDRESVRRSAAAPRSARKVSGPWRHIDAAGRERLVDALSYMIDFAGRPGVLVTAWDVTARALAERALRESEENYRHTVELSPQLPWLADPYGQVTAMSPRWSEITGLSCQETLGTGWVAAIHPEDASMITARWADCVASGRSFDVEIRCRLADGGYRWFRSRAAARRDEAGRLIRWYGTAEDIHERKLAEAALRESEAFARSVVESSIDCVKVLDTEGRLLFMNGPGRPLMGLDNFAEFEGRLWPSMLPGEMATAANQAVAAARAGQTSHFSGFCPTAKGVAKWWDVVVSPVRGAGGEVVRLLAVSRDVTERRAAEQQIAYMAYHDPLTDLGNRRLFRQQLEQALAALRPGEHLALHCIDLDHFKGVNDTLGHAAGDALLRQAADRLRRCIPDGGMVARLGGDEFAIIQPGLRGPEDAATLARRIVAVLDQDYQIDDQQTAAGASVGIALASEGDTLEEMIRNADIALYRAKADGRATFRFFEREMDEAVHRRQELRLGLRTALERNELQLHFQPLVALRAGEVNCFEALLRWQHPVRGMISPAEFIPVAEETGLIIRLGEWVLRAACEEAMRWPDDIRIAVNLSPAQVRNPGLLQLVAEVLAESGLPACRLELEITESALLQDDQANLAVLRELSALGVRIALDDFGTGFSALGYLLQFPFDKIKIDRSFVLGLPGRRESKAIIRAVVSMSRSLGISVAAEGVETVGQLSALRRLGCSEAQGYLFSRPVPAAAVLGLIAKPRLARQHGLAGPGPAPVA
jgi:diguanylate cyclase (GGDEF)-like protein/PAS domain S-box-containing protein